MDQRWDPRVGSPSRLAPPNPNSPHFGQIVAHVPSFVVSFYQYLCDSIMYIYICIMYTIHPCLAIFSWFLLNISSLSALHLPSRRKLSLDPSPPQAPGAETAAGPHRLGPAGRSSGSATCDPWPWAMPPRPAVKTGGPWAMGGTKNTKQSWG